MSYRYSARCLTAIVIAVSAQVCSAATKPIPGDYSGTVVSLGNCAFTPNNPAKSESGQRILAAIAAALISQGVNKLGKAIADAGAAKTWTATASRNLQATTAQFPQCVQIVRGRFFNDPPASSQSAWAHLEDARVALNANGSYPAQEPDFFFEGEFVGPTQATGKEDKKTAIALRPTGSYLGVPIGSRTLRPSDERSIAIFLSITSPGQAVDLAKSPAATVVLGKHAPGVLRRYGKRDPQHSSPWESAWFSIAASDVAQPLTANALETETQDESKFLTFLGGILSDDTVKSKITTEVQQAVIPSAAATAAAAKDTALAALRNTQSDAFTVAVQKLEACYKTAGGQAGEKVAAGRDAASALRTFYSADQALPNDDPKKLSSLSLDDIDGTNGINLRKPDSIPDKCNDIKTTKMITP